VNNFVNLQPINLTPIGVNPFRFSNPITNPLQPFVNQTNYVGQLTLPNTFFPTQVLGLENIANPNETLDEIKTQNIDWKSAQEIPCLMFGINCQSGLFDKFTSVTGNYLKNVGLLALALVFVAFGLYLLAKQTDTGAAVINIAKKI
jgi:hypothetical protein